MILKVLPLRSCSESRYPTCPTLYSGRSELAISGSLALGMWGEGPAMERTWGEGPAAEIT